MMPTAWAVASASIICTAYERVVQVLPTGRYEFAQHFSGNEIHDYEVRPVLTVDVVNRNDVGMVQRRGSLGLLNEPALALRVGDLIRPQNLDGDKPGQSRIAGLVDNAHAAFASWTRGSRSARWSGRSYRVAPPDRNRCLVMENFIIIITG